MISPEAQSPYADLVVAPRLWRPLCRTGGATSPAWEQPALHAKEIRDCFAKVLLTSAN